MSKTFKPKFVILISGRGSNMQSIINAIQSDELDAEVTAVISNRPDAAGLMFARNAGIANEILDHKNFTTREAFDEELMQLIDSFDPDYVVLAGFMRILSREFVQHYANRLINIHPSLLPKFKGMHTHKRAIDAGETEHGASVHFVTEELDAGPVILQAKVPVMADDTEETLAARVLLEEHKLYPDALRLLIQQHQS
ncbi:MULTISPECIES: phosphoribosylglycinamide formyltransferase [unclassified Methylophaga]|jgi:phosphoribosylglycinamide formyltransferase-1|uniref:phosphoribosylglycinamide formyltransferase n=1 Tax=unclassified Methylophaga TaxID=2629249 RepID=UPI000C993391|nr:MULTISPECIES: phosphoribosylglycinamide formyltransferase [unclassified Methylophaga]MAK65399.1 phosphoribosylglycinamide formyltransferase [Methylophaga sp.]MAY16123.1 phosphoribosylglycinamide formyltransferase [Methylophaga sp.]HAO25138.1 phosphoribosylglycinamide formyltransferase [Methylophaga sp.]HCD04083.1 phosphoribosylglycinamide formyltransferase [Methylophaga sp.]|tara:strand:- start:2866 stop:3456 length:591 start_codon:yes stop_codon:yes gene_type:complete